VGGAVCLVHLQWPDTPERIVSRIWVRWVQNFRHRKSGGMKSGVSAHCTLQLEWRHVLRHAR